jgi:hypothetical protein
MTKALPLGLAEYLFSPTSTEASQKKSTKLPKKLSKSSKVSVNTVSTLCTSPAIISNHLRCQLPTPPG